MKLDDIIMNRNNCVQCGKEEKHNGKKKTQASVIPLPLVSCYTKLVVLMPVCFSVPPLPLPFFERKIKLFSTFWGQSLFSTKLCDGFYTGLLLERDQLALLSKALTQGSLTTLYLKISVCKLKHLTAL